VNTNPLILCSTARLARSLRHLHDRKLAAQQQQWQPLLAFTLNVWLDETLEQALLCGEIAPEDVPRGSLSSSQERLLWEQAIEATLQDLDAAPLFDKAGLASAAQEANRLLIEWNISLPNDELAEETRQFLLWRQRLQVLCKQAGWLESVRYFSWQVQMIESGKGELPPEIGLAGFDRISPLQQRLFDVLRQRGVKVETYPLVFDAPQTKHRFELNDQDTECRAAVAWAQQKLAQDPAAKLAIVVPELSALHQKLGSWLDEAFQAQTVTPQLAQSPRTYDFSLGVPLSTQPVVAAALNLLRFGFQHQAIPQSEISELLHNPYWSSGKEADARAQLDASMREWLPLTLTPQRFQHFVHKSINGEKPLLVAVLHQDLQTLLQRCQAEARRQAPSVWAAAFKTILQASRWPGERSLSSVEYQAIQSFEKVLRALADLDQLSGHIAAADAIKRLSQLCKEQIFQPEAQEGVQLQVLGMLEAAAEPLDAMWVMGMNDHVWPPAPNPNPLIPASLQRAVGTPNADSRVQMEFATAIHERLRKSARVIVFSSALKDGERTLRLSPLLHGVTQTENPPPLFATLAEQMPVHAPKHLHCMDDARAPAIAEGHHVSGGTGLLKAQAICPAWAFYQYRLHARALKAPVNGLDAMERGTLVHAVLERFWENRGAQDLQTLTPGQLEIAVSSSVTQALQAFNQTRDESLSPTFIALEQARLTKLALAWLTEVEMQRPMGFVVTAREQEEKVLIEGLSIRLVVDRIDTLEDGSLLLMDYKTGRNNNYKNWAEPRITEPQLPIYAAFVLSDAECEVAAVCYAQVRIGENGFLGIARDTGLVDGVVALDEARARKYFSASEFPDWLSLLQHWKTSIAAIARELKSGEAAIKFANEKQLAYCEVLPLLRLPERLLQYERPELTSKMQEVCE
jgi:probable DNA repair protein